MAKVEADEVASRGWHIAEGVDSRNARPTHRNKIPYASWSRGKLFTPMPSIRGTTKGFHSMSMSGNQLIAFLSPTIGLIFTAFLLPLWLNNRSRSYIPYFVVAFVLYTLATSSQLFLVPGDTGRTAPITSIFYLSCIVLLTEGCLKRRNRDTSYRLTAAICGVSLIGVCYYYFADRNLITRIYILSVGCGLLFAIAAYRLRPSRDSCLVDKAIFWIFLLMSAQIFLRPPADRQARRREYRSGCLPHLPVLVGAAILVGRIRRRHWIDAAGGHLHRNHGRPQAAERHRRLDVRLQPARL